ncbi:MAG: hypothetical protein H6581_15625 [Bacteroidia bacterium]|nr:hypothetical protein [Bacteroidia bacterium]
MCKITSHGKTLVGNNEDAWALNPRIWFETGQNGHLGVAYVGHKDDFPQGGMNEAGLVYDAFSLTPHERKGDRSKPHISDPVAFLKTCMQTCKTVSEVKNYMEAHDRGYFNAGMFLFVDSSGNYLVMESDSLMEGHDSTFALVNFRLSETPDPNEIQISRYQKALKYLAQGTDSSAKFCTSVMDTMAACRGDLGDGTLYTVVWDLQEKGIHLNFYHDFSQTISLSLNAELAQGNHTLQMPEIFAKVPEFERLKAYKTPMNSRFVQLLVVVEGILLLLLSLYFGIQILLSIFGKKTIKQSPAGVIAILPLLVSNLLIIILIPVLLLREPIFYFGIKGSLAAYPFPGVKWYPLITFFMTILGLIPLLQISRKKESSRTIKIALVLNLMLCLVALAGFLYWGIFIP